MTTNTAGIRIGLNAACYSRQRVGISTYVENVLPVLAARRSLVIYTSEPDAFAGIGAELRPIPAWTRTLRGRLLWQYVFLPGLLKQDRVDLLFSPVPELPTAIRIPAVAVVHDLTPLVVKGSSSLQARVLFELGLRLLQRASALITGSEHTKKDLQQRGFYAVKTITAIPHGTDFPSVGRHAFRNDSVGENAEPGDCETEELSAGPFVLYVGGFLPTKNVPRLIRAYRQLAPEIPHRLVLVGWGQDRVIAGLRRMIVEAGLADRVAIVHGLCRKTLIDLYSRCELFVFPSLYEGFGYPVLEAMASGAPVLCSSAASLPEIGGDAVRYFSPSSEVELLDGMRQLLANPALRRELARKGKVRARVFTWERAAAAYEAVFEAVLKGSPTSPNPGRTDDGGRRSACPAHGVV